MRNALWCAGPRHFASVFECRPTHQAQPRALVRADRDVVAAVPMVNHRDGSRARRRQRVLQHRQQLDLGGEKESERYELNEPRIRLRPLGHVNSPRGTSEPPTATSGHRSGESAPRRCPSSRGACTARRPVPKASPVWPISAAHTAERPRLAGAWGSPRLAEVWRVLFSTQRDDVVHVAAGAAAHVRVEDELHRRRDARQDGHTQPGGYHSRAASLVGAARALLASKNA